MVILTLQMPASAMENAMEKLKKLVEAKDPMILALMEEFKIVEFNFDVEQPEAELTDMLNNSVKLHGYKGDKS